MPALVLFRHGDTLTLGVIKRRLNQRDAARDVLARFSGEAPEESTGGGTSDARFIAPLGAQCIEVGPVNASIHKVDEHVAVAELEALPGLYLALLERLQAQPLRDAGAAG